MTPINYYCYKPKNKSGAGFTLIELLVVISIIGMLSTIVLSSLGSARAKSRDANRKASLVQLSRALELYYDKFGKYPDMKASCITSGWVLSSSPGCSADWATGLTEFIPTLTNPPGFPSSYFQYSSRTVANSGDNNQSYKLLVAGVESEKVPVTSPWAYCSASCTSGPCSPGGNDTYYTVTGSGTSNLAFCSY